MRATRSSSPRTSRSVPWRSPPSERGKSSYQAENRASGRSTHTGTARSESVAYGRGSWAAIRSARAGSSALAAAAELVAPGGEAVDPGPHRERVAAEHLDRERRGEAVVAERPHAHLAESALAVAAVAGHGGDDVVTVGEHIRGHLDAVAGHTLHGEAAAVDARAQVLDDDPPPAVGVGDGAAREFAGCP